jgi:hypothetical protein
VAAGCDRAYALAESHTPCTQTIFDSLKFFTDQAMALKLTTAQNMPKGGAFDELSKYQHVRFIRCGGWHGIKIRISKFFEIYFRKISNMRSVF